MRESGDAVKTGPDRDRALDDMLRHAFTADAAGTPAGACLDAETAAAWMEDTLSPTDRAAAEAHTAGCPRCQALLGAIAQAEQAAAPARAWWRGSAIRWLAPAGLTAAAGLALLLLLPREATRQNESQVARSEAPQTVAPTPSQPASTTPQASDGAAISTPALADARRQSESKSSSRADSLKETRQAAAAKPLEERDEKAKDALARSREGAIAPAVPSLPPVAPIATLPNAAPAPVPPANPTPPPPSATTAAAQSTLAKTTAQERSAAGVAGGVGAGRAGNRAPADAAPYALNETVSISREAISPDPQRRWRLASGSAIERSTDGGKTWTAQNAPSHPELMMAAAPTPTVCWIVGRAGTVLLTVDGRRWQTVAFPESVDLVAIAASSADAATVTTSDGRTFATTDRGRSWSRR